MRLSQRSSTPSTSFQSFPIPAEMRALVLDGIGFEHLQVRNVPTPRPGARQMLARVDAAGICTSLIKIIEQSGAHRLLYGWDVARYPLILGDEGAVTLVDVGQALRDRYRPGERYVIQPAVDHAPINHRQRYRDGGRGVEKVAVGYTLGGHLAEYILVTEEILEARCLRPLPGPNLPYAHAAMSEPFSCVISGQEHHVHLVQESPLAPRTVVQGPRAGGVTVVVGAGVMGRMHVDLALSRRPRAIVALDLIDQRFERVERLFGARAEKLGISLHVANPNLVDVGRLIDGLTDRRGADDVIVAVGSRSAIEGAQGYAGRGGVLNLFGGLRAGEDTVGLDAGIVHYKEVIVTGSSGGSPWDVDRALTLMAAGEIDAGAHITRIGDLNHAVAFLEMVKNRQIDGKAVVYPHRRTQEMFSTRAWTAEDEEHYLAGEGTRAFGSRENPL